MKTRPGVAALALCALLPPLSQAQHEPRTRAPLPSAAVIAALPADGGDEFNRLIHEASPYLRQHARNPVDWFPWGSEAFELAQKENKPVFLSVGYSTCHWCHVMEHESFEDPEVAELMNEHFVCIKVDREERPDIDDVYMTVTQQMTGRGGWPMTVVMTPDKRPFFAGTYFPKRGAGRRVGMMELVPRISEAWSEQPGEVSQMADSLVARLRQVTGGTPGEALEASLLGATTEALKERFDPVRGGFSQAPKFPVPHNVRLLMRQYARTGDGQLLEMVEKTLQEMRRGGIWDHVGFGFHRYSTDRRWLVPHFEKMLYDQALISMAYVEAWQITKKPEYRQTASEIFEYVLRDLTDSTGGFYSAEDADSEGEEGLFYLWRVEELEAVLGEDDARFASSIWNVTAEGNYADEATGRKTGRSIPHYVGSLEARARELGMEPDELARRTETVRSKLFAAREGRIHPFKDDKILTDWNGLMIAALAKGGAAFGETRYVDAARKAADYLMSTLTGEQGRLFKRARGGQVSLPGMLEDYAFATWGLLNLYEATFDVRYLKAAKRLTDTSIEHFRDTEQGGFFLAPDDGEALIVRSKGAYDGAIPSGNSVAALNVIRLSRYTGTERYAELCESTMSAFSGLANRSPDGMTQMMMALDYVVGPSFEVVVAGELGSEDTRAMLAKLRANYLPSMVVLHRPGGTEPPIGELAPYVLGQGPRAGRATAYVCQDFVCSEPTADLQVMLERLAHRRED